MKNKKNPKEFLGAKVLSTFDDARIKGGFTNHNPKYHKVCTGQYQGHLGQCPMQQQQEVQNEF